MYGIDDYEVTGNQVLVQVEMIEKEKSIIIKPKEKKDKASKWMAVVKVGPMVTSVEVGDVIIMGDPSAMGMAQLSFGGVAYMQISEHTIIGKIPLGKVKIKEILSSN